MQIDCPLNMFETGPKKKMKVPGKKCGSKGPVVKQSNGVHMMTSMYPCTPIIIAISLFLCRFAKVGAFLYEKTLCYLHTKLTGKNEWDQPLYFTSK